MYSFIEIALVNAVMIVPLALLAVAAGGVFRRPALIHALWVLILIKLIVPPLWQIPLLNPDWVSRPAHQFLHPLFSEPERVADQNPIEQWNRLRLRAMKASGDESNVAVKPRPRPRTLADQDKLIATRRNSPLAIAAQWVRSEATQQIVVSTLIGVWGLGSILWFAVQGVRCIRFRWALARGTAAPMELQQISNQFAQRLGLSQSPTVWLMPGVMSPMLWGNGHSTLLIFPERLLDRLDQESIGTLLTHELAHFRRRDHWVRVLALMATGFYWWHPVVWWARRQIEAVEEECCDAIVVKSTTSRPKRYAEAILETIDFLTDYGVRLPPLATGLSQFPILRQRLTWIMRGPRPQDFGRCGRVLCLLLASMLPIQPTWVAARAAKPVPEMRPPIRPLQIDLTPQSRPQNSESSETESVDLAAVPSDSESAPSIAPSKWLGFEVQSYSFDKRFVYMSNQTTQILLDIQTGRDFDLTPFNIISMAFSPDTNQFATVDNDRFLRLWDAEICDFQSWQVPGGPSKSVDISYGGRWMVTGGRDGVVRIWSVASQRPIRELPRESTSVSCVRFSPDGELLAVSTGDSMSPQSGRIALFNVGSWTERISMNWNSSAAAVAFHSDGETLSSVDWQGRIARWSVETGELLGLLDGKKELIAAAEFSPNGSPLIDIEIPDLDPNGSWGEPSSDQQFRWFFGSWPLTSPANSSGPVRAMSAKTAP